MFLSLSLSFALALRRELLPRVSMSRQLGQLPHICPNNHDDNYPSKDKGTCQKVGPQTGKQKRWY